MSGADRITVAAFSNGFFKKPIEVCTVFGDFGFIKNGNGLDVSILVKVINLFGRKCCRFCDGAGMETQVPGDSIKVGLVWGDFKKMAGRKIS